MRGARSAYGGEMRCLKGFWWGNLREEDHLVDAGVDGRIILRWIFKEVGCGITDRVKLANVRDRWQALLNAVMNLQVS